MQTETILELGDAIRDEEGPENPESSATQLNPLESLYTSLEATREALNRRRSPTDRRERPRHNGSRC